MHVKSNEVTCSLFRPKNSVLNLFQLENCNTYVETLGLYRKNKIEVVAQVHLCVFDTKWQQWNSKLEHKQFLEKVKLATEQRWMNRRQVEEWRLTVINYYWHHHVGNKGWNEYALMTLMCVTTFKQVKFSEF